MVVMTFVQWVVSTDDSMKRNSVGYDPRLRKDVYERLLFSLPDVVIWIVREVGIGDIVA